MDLLRELAPHAFLCAGGVFLYSKISKIEDKQKEIMTELVDLRNDLENHTAPEEDSDDDTPFFSRHFGFGVAAIEKLRDALPVWRDMRADEIADSSDSEDESDSDDDRDHIKRKRERKLKKRKNEQKK